jgi:hypothetical protein
VPEGCILGGVGNHVYVVKASRQLTRSVVHDSMSKHLAATIHTHKRETDLRDSRTAFLGRWTRSAVHPRRSTSHFSLAANICVLFTIKQAHARTHTED